jgi:hypothetical protein
MKFNIIRTANLFLAVLIVLIVGGCDSAEVTDGTVSLSFSPTNISNKANDNIIQLDTVKILLRDIKIKNQSGNGEPQIKTEPIVVYLSLSNMTTDFAVSNIPPGNYNRIRFSIHKLEASETPPDPEFRESADSSKRYSVIVKGLYNSIPFVYKSKKSAHQDIKLEEPLVVENNAEANLTITVDPLDWFYKNDVLLDPNDASNENDIDNNIKHSFKKCFRDDNYDGRQ